MDKIDDKDMLHFDETLSRYIKGQLSDTEEMEFKKLLAENPELCNKAIATAHLTKAMNDVGNANDRNIIDLIKKTSLADAEDAVAKACETKIENPLFLMSRRFMITFSVAASFTLCVFGGYKYYKYDQITSLGLEYLAYFPASEFSSGETDSVRNNLGRLYSNIETKSGLDVAIADLRALWNESLSDTYNDYTEYMPEIGWMRANAYLCDNDKSKALEVLETLIKEYPEGTAMGDKARELKAKVEKL